MERYTKGIFARDNDLPVLPQRLGMGFDLIVYGPEARP